MRNSDRTHEQGRMMPNYKETIVLGRSASFYEFTERVRVPENESEFAFLSTDGKNVPVTMHACIAGWNNIRTLPPDGLRNKNALLERACRVLP